MLEKIRGLVTARYAYKDPTKPQCLIVKNKEYAIAKIGLDMAERILELKGAVVVGDLRSLDISETGFIPEEDSEDGGSENEDSEEEDSEEMEFETESTETATLRKNKSSKRKGRK